MQRDPLFLSRRDVERLLAPDVCAAAVEAAFRQHASGDAVERILGLHARDGSFHVKAGLLMGEQPYFAAKVNANFPHNSEHLGLPTIQGLVILQDGANGLPLAVLDSVAITALRTAAATAIAAKYLARQNAESALICGCGAQAPAQARAILGVRDIRRLYVFDKVHERADRFADNYGAELAIPIIPVAELAPAVSQCDVVVTCTTARKFFITREMVRAGTFVAAVGADNEDKQEIDPSLLAAATVVTDITEQACAIGDLHHAIAGHYMSRAAIHAELGDIVTGKKQARTDENQIIVFDSTGTGLQDVAAAATVFRLACNEDVNVRTPIGRA
jgi:ornithine cyclodeaminase/alanine dehydrogenase-like protein (mu-crystallin family)